MNVYIDESGSINNKRLNDKYFVICLLKVNDVKRLQKAYKNFIAANIERLKELDQDKIIRNGEIKKGGKMFANGKFAELKGSQLDRPFKKEFLQYFLETEGYEIYFLKVYNERLDDKFCNNTARAFNYIIKLALACFFRKGFFEGEECILQFDERNEKPEAKYFLQNYLNTELSLEHGIECNFAVSYFDSKNNKLIQLADVFSNIMYSDLKTGAYSEELKMLQDKGIIKYIFEFPKQNVDNNG